MSNYYYFLVFGIATLLSVNAQCLAATLKNRKIQCCTLEQYPSVSRSDSAEKGLHGFMGIGMEYLEKLQRMLKFECKSIKNYSNDTGFTDFVKAMYNCSKGIKHPSHPDICDCELGAGGFSNTGERYGLAKLLVPYIHDSYQTITAIANTNSSSVGIFFISAFSVWVWLLIFFLVTVFIILKLCDIRFEPIENSLKYSSSSGWNRFKFKFYQKSKRVRQATKSVLESLIGRSFKPFSGDSQSMRSWTANFIISLCGLFLMLTYEAGMVANLVQDSLSSPYNSLRDFQFCRIKPHEVCVYGKGATYDFWRNNIATSIERNCPRLQAQLENQGTKYMPQAYDSFDEVIENVANNENGCKYLFSDGITAINALYGKHCGKLVQVGEKTYPKRQGFIAQINWNQAYEKEINNATYYLEESNQLVSLEQYEKSISNCSVQLDKTINLGKLKIFFIVAFSACLILLIHMFLDPQEEKAGRPSTLVPLETDSSSDDAEIEIYDGKSLSFSKITV